MTALLVTWIHAKIHPAKYGVHIVNFCDQMHIAEFIGVPAYFIPFKFTKNTYLSYFFHLKKNSS